MEAKGAQREVRDIMELKTDRLLIREFLPSDLNSFRRYVQSEHHWRSMPQEQPPTNEEAEALLKHFLQTKGNVPRTEYHLAAVDKASNEFVGAVDLCLQADKRRGDIGWGMVGGRVGHGLATEMSHAVLRFALGALRLHRVQAQCHAENHPSRRIMAKLGMREETVIKDHLFVRGVWWSTVQSAVLSIELEAHPLDGMSQRRQHTT
jgi:ribosomal-protein-alanine N-acetyltransferase